MASSELMRLLDLETSKLYQYDARKRIEIQNAEDEIKAQENQFQELKKRAAETRKQEEEKMASLQKEVQANERCFAAAIATKKSTDLLRIEIGELSKTSKGQLESTQRLGCEYAQLRSTMSKLMTDMDIYQAKAAEEIKTETNALNALKQETEEYEAHTKKVILGMKDEILKLSEDIGNNETEIAKTGELTESKNKELAEIEAKDKTLKDEIANSVANLTESQNKAKTLEEQLKNLKIEYEDVQKQILTTENDCTDLENSIETMRQEIRKLQQEKFANDPWKLEMEVEESEFKIKHHEEMANYLNEKLETYATEEKQFLENQTELAEVIFWFYTFDWALSWLEFLSTWNQLKSTWLDSSRLTVTPNTTFKV